MRLQTDLAVLILSEITEILAKKFQRLQLSKKTKHRTCHMMLAGSMKKLLVLIVCLPNSDTGYSDVTHKL